MTDHSDETVIRQDDNHWNYHAINVAKNITFRENTECWCRGTFFAAWDFTKKVSLI